MMTTRMHISSRNQLKDDGSGEVMAAASCCMTFGAVLRNSLQETESSKSFLYPRV
jgi:hypothetical protein